MGKSIVCVLLCILALTGVTSRSVLKGLFPGYNYPRQQNYPYNYNNDYRRRPPAPVRSYNDICRLVNLNGFTNPGGVPKCIK
ncbi:uncharacterized protein [Drosophila takahashii]|uniref:uncharacterized protein n=1 Tax=Drosophila takahashii TaxID=29030 RepID=UPI001CF81764|nr:uncharacterized protein LOC123003145 [Drosophila takahashii]